MQYVLAIALLGFNFWISWSNARSVGRYWSESKEVGGSFRRLVVCGYVMAIAGFTMVYSYLLFLIAPAVFAAMGYSRTFVSDLQSLGLDLTYVMVGAAMILSGFRITVQSLKNAWEDRTFSFIAQAGWNTYAQLHNVVSYARNAPSAFGRIIGALFGGKKSKSKKDSYAVFLAILIVVLAIFGGYFTANAIMKRADEEYDAFANAYQTYERQNVV